MDRKIIVTEDKSKTLLIPALNETYHSVHGAYKESMHVFIEAGLMAIENKKQLSIFEMGFGTGLNALLTAEEALKHKIEIDYHTIEKYPLKASEIDALGYDELIQTNNSRFYKKLHQLDWNKKCSLHPFFNIFKQKEDLHIIQLSPNTYDLIYFDAFGPATQVDLWSVEIMQRMFNTLKPGGIFITYCAQGQFKRNLKSAGFIIENLPGPKGKREITRGFKP